MRDEGQSLYVTCEGLRQPTQAAERTLCVALASRIRLARVDCRRSQVSHFVIFALSGKRRDKSSQTHFPLFDGDSGTSGRTPDLPPENSTS